jgi:hypothetical protein
MHSGPTQGLEVRIVQPNIGKWKGRPEFRRLCSSNGDEKTTAVDDICDIQSRMLMKLCESDRSHVLTESYVCSLSFNYVIPLPVLSKKNAAALSTVKSAVVA